ncbi:MAG: DNA-nicking Smr family endonuclease [Alteromonadaceae bacterium]|jgi:DNA-nicking Smr family endonuclease
MSKNNPISEDDLTLFHQSINDREGKTQRLKQDKIHPTPAPGKEKTQQKSRQAKARQAGFYFSDEFIPNLPTQGPLSYVRQGSDSYLAKQLRRGDFYPDLVLDLHGYNKQNAKLELADLIEECQKKHIRCATIITGLGEYILKQKVPHYLVQHPAIEAFHEAPKEWGGKAAVLILVELSDR